RSINDTGLRPCKRGARGVCCMGYIPTPYGTPHHKEDVMAISSEKLQAVQQEQFNATMRLANVAMANAQKMVALQAQAARAMFEDSVVQAQAMTQAGADPKSMLEARTVSMQKSAQHMMDMSKQMAETFAGMQAEFQQLLTEHMQSSGSRMMEGMQALFSGLPAMPTDATKMFEQAAATM